MIYFFSTVWGLHHSRITSGCYFISSNRHTLPQHLSALQVTLEVEVEVTPGSGF